MTVISISEKPGAGSSTTAKLLAKKLGIKHFSPGRVFKDIGLGIVKKQYYYPLLKELCEEKKLEIPLLSATNDSNAVTSFWKTPLGKSKELHNILDELSNNLARKDNIVIDGKLAVKLVKKSDLRVWLEASLQIRAKRTSKRDSINQQTAEKLILEREEKERKEWQKIYGFDYFNQKEEADLIINTSKISPEQIVEKIISTLNIQTSRN
ncbi:MAG: AAA family ATPase [Nanoarchaeota archaeon]|nr:AAA family ATPase [Nanoarchaeota archaeon]